MPVITVLPHPEYCPAGARVEAAPGTSICEALLENDIEIEEVRLDRDTSYERYTAGLDVAMQPATELCHADDVARLEETLSLE